MRDEGTTQDAVSRCVIYDMIRLRVSYCVCSYVQVERERGITVKAQTVSLVYRYPPGPGGQPYLLNLIDTPGAAVTQCGSDLVRQ